MLSDQHLETHRHSGDRKSTAGRYVKACGLVLSGYFLAIIDLRSTLSINTSYASSNMKRGHWTRAIGDVQWYKCPGVDDPKVECGNIIVPLDYFNSSAGTATIALGKYKADPASRRGSIFMNPGGPGGPGVWLAARAGSLLASTRFGPYYDLIGFDPRGVGETTPKADCFESIASMDQFYRNTVFELGFTQPPNTTVSSPSPDAKAAQQHAFDDIVIQQRQALAIFETQAKLCTKNLPNGGADLNYMGTTSVVRDIAFMTDVLDGKGAKINYWGGSYGSVLGMVLFNMMPDRVGKGMIEAIANPVHWVGQHSHEWMDTWIQDADKTYRWFLDSCAKAGEGECALARGNISDKAIERNIEAFIDKLYTAPMPSIDSLIPAYLTSGTVRSQLCDAMKSPNHWFEFAADLDAAIHGNPVPLLNKILPDPTRDRFDHANLARFAVTCIDSLPFNKSNPSTFPTPESLARQSGARVKNVSKYFGASTGLTDIDGGCQFWPVNGVERYTGPWNRTLANPVLVVSTLVDPITPLASAKFVNNLLGNSSRLIIVNTPGHGIPYPSLCQAKAMLDYFNDGILPKDELLCETEVSVFGNRSKVYAALSKADQELVSADAKVIEMLQGARRGVF